MDNEESTRGEYIPNLKSAEFRVNAADKPRNLNRIYGMLNGFEVSPQYRVMLSSPDAYREFDQIWNTDPIATLLARASNGFLLKLSRPSIPQWLHVYTQNPTDVPSRVFRATNTEEMITLSTGTESLFAFSISKEEREYWIISRALTPTESTPDDPRNELYSAVRRIVEQGCTLAELLHRLSSAGVQSNTAIGLMKVLDEACGMSANNTRYLAREVGNNWSISELDDLQKKETIWRSLVNDHLYEKFN